MKEQITKLVREALSSSDIVITIPKTIKWSDYQKELDAVKDGNQVLNFKVRNFPNTKIGNKCYLSHNGNIIGWMKIVGLSEKSFTCTTTGKVWSGKFIERSGPFHYLESPIPMKGFRGFRYFNKLN